MKRTILLTLIFSLGIIAVLLYFTIDDSTIAFLKSAQINYWFFALAVLLNFVYWGIWGLRLKILADCIEPPYKIKWWKSAKVVMANMFLANVTPSMAGGEPVRIYLLKEDGLSVGGATAAVVGERLLDATFLLVCFPIAFFILGSSVDSLPLRIGIGIAAAIFCLLLVAFAIAMKYPEKMKRLLCWIGVKLKRFSKEKKVESITERISEEVDRFHSSMMFYLSEGRKPLVFAFLATASFWIVGWIVPSMILMGLGLGPMFVQSCAAQILVVIIAMMPTTPGSAGVTEGGLAGLYAIFIPASLVGLFTVLYRFASYYVGLIVGAIFQHRMLNSLSKVPLDEK